MLFINKYEQLTVGVVNIKSNYIIDNRVNERDWKPITIYTYFNMLPSNICVTPCTGRFFVREEALE